jgi:predicted AlkP superfamily pyrophosphatase or phosphodiesterase
VPGRVILVLADGLRPDVVTRSYMPSMHALSRDYTRARHASTIRPRVTVAALASLATGVSPRTHRLTEPGLGFLKRLPRLKPLGAELARHGHAVIGVGPEMGIASRSIAAPLARAAGIQRLVPGGQTARALAQTALAELSRIDRGLIFLYLADCDGAGHAHEWMSPPYLAAAGRVDAAIGELAHRRDRDLLIIVADHGGGGVEPRDHDIPHPLNDRIPLVLAGPRVRRRTVLTRPASLLDVPATILWALDVPVPASYEGRALLEAFSRSRPARESVA